MITDVTVSLLALAAFGVGLWACRAVPTATGAVELATDGIVSMLDSELEDRARERAVRRAGLDLVVGTLGVLWRVGVAVAVAAAPILIADLAGVASRDAVLELMLRTDYVVIVSVVGILLAVVARRLRPTHPTDPTDPTDLTAARDKGDDNRYSTADRLLHAMAFASPGVLRTVSRLEDRLLTESAREPSGPPVFVTSVARAGTTALLNALHDLPGVATHTYRDMPFLTAPGLWNTIAGRRRVETHERAHGDGLEIDLDSPEAFEEVVWRMYWPERYRGPSIPLWGADDRHQGAEQFLRQHMGKVVRARLAQSADDRGRPGGSARYCSKNNTNIGRIPYLRDAFPGCRIVVPIRRPECHAASLLRQHHNFLELQAADDFVRRYMRDLGHFEFGLIHKPIEFPGFDPTSHDPTTGDYWLDYWIHAFRHLLEHRDDCLLVSQDDLRSSPQETMASLCTALDLDPGPADFTDYFHSNPDEHRTDVYDQDLYAEAAALHGELVALALPARA